MGLSELRMQSNTLMPASEAPAANLLALEFVEWRTVGPAPWAILTTCFTAASFKQVL